MRDLDLPRRLRLAGLTVTEVDGWQTRGKDDLAARGSVNHHTAGPRSGTAPSLGVIINGRGGANPLPGPLANVYGPREESLRVFLVAAGKANHAGLGGFRGLVGNSTVYGLEEEHSGQPDEPLSELRIDRIARVHAAFLLGRADASWVCQHYEWAPTRKIDFIRARLDPNDLRARVASRLSAMTASPVLPPEELPMGTLINDPTNGHTYVIGPPSDVAGKPAGVGRMVFLGISNHPDGVNVTAAGMKSLISAYGQPIYTP